MMPLDDLPEAARDTPLGGNPATPGLRLSKTVRWLLWVVLAAMVALLAGSVAAWYQAPGSANSGTATPLQGIIRPAGTTTEQADDPQAVRDRAVQLAP